MEKPIYTLFQIIRENTRSYPIILYDDPKRYYKMLRTIIGIKTGVFKGTDKISRLYNEKSEWKNLLVDEKFNEIDIKLMEERLRLIYNDRYGPIYILDCYEQATPHNIFVLLIGITYILFIINVLNHIRIFAINNSKYVYNAIYNYSSTYSIISQGDAIEY